MNAKAAAREHIPALDGVRAIAVLMVIFFHFCQATPQLSHSLIGKMSIWGQTGVDLFFVLSGFLITGILLDSKGSDHFLRNFYARRTLRIFPLYYATLAGVYIVWPLLGLLPWVPFSQNFWYWFYLQNIPSTFAPKLLGPGPGHFWSLAVEEHFYLLWPFLVMRFNNKALLRLTFVAVAMALAVRVILLPFGSFYFTFARFDALAIGGAIAIYGRMRHDGIPKLARWSRAMLAVLVPVLVVMQLKLSGNGLPILQIVKSTLIALVYGAVVALAVDGGFGRFTGRLLGGRILGSVGKYSYGMYVFHPFVMMSAFSAGLNHGVSGLLFVAIATYFAAWLSWTVFEKRFLRLKRHFEYEAPRVSPLATGAAT